jgi:hypothetical protein
MRNHIAVLIALASSVLVPARAQSTTQNTAPARLPELALSYDLVGSNAPAGQCGCFVMNGGGATAAFPLPAKDLSIVGQLSATHSGSIGSPKYSLTLVTYTIGLRYPLPLHSEHFKLFVQGLIGGAHSSGSLVAASNVLAENSHASLAGSVGAGVDIRWKHNVSIRALEVDYMPTTFDNSSSALENNYRISAGIVFHLPVH